MSQFLLFIETMPLSMNVVKLHTRDNLDGIPVTVYVRRNKPNQWQWKVETSAGQGLWNSGDLDEIKNFWRALSLR